jgi:hypothetical protein
MEAFDIQYQYAPEHLEDVQAVKLKFHLIENVESDYND